MRTTTTVRIDDNLTSRQTRIAVRTANNELSRRIHQQPIVALQQLAVTLVTLSHLRQQNLTNILFYLRLRHIGIMLRGHHNRIYPQRFTFVRIFHRHLTLRIGTEIAHFLAFLAYTRKRIY